MISGVPAHVDGRMLGDHRGRRRAGSSTPTGCGTTPRASSNWDPIWAEPRHPDPARPVVAVARRDRQAAARRRSSRASTPSARSSTSWRTGHDYSWFVLTQKIIEKEFALSGSEQNPDLTGKDVRSCCVSRVGPGAPGPVEAFKRARRGLRRRATTLPELVAGMNALTDEPLLDADDAASAQIVARDREIDNPFTKDAAGHRASAAPAATAATS